MKVKKKKQFMLKLDHDDPQKELEFEVQCSLAISLEDRIKKMLELMKRILQLANKYEDRKPYQIIKRPSR